MTGSTADLPIADYALIGDCRTAALVSRGGSIDWCCLPRFDSGSVFARLLDTERGGWCSVVPTDKDGGETNRGYLAGSLVLETTFERAAGSARLIDFFVIPEDDAPDAPRRLVRIVEGVRGSVEFTLELVPRFDYGDVRPWLRGYGDHLFTATGGNDALVIGAEMALERDGEHALRSRFTVHADERHRLVMSYLRPERVEPEPPTPSPTEIDAGLERTLAWWRQWCERIASDEEPALDVRRSGLALKALTYEPTGAIIAAATTSLPEAIPGERNWDYRYSWVRDASFSSRSFAEIGCAAEADAFRRFIMRSAAGHAGDLRIVYGPGGERRIGSAGAARLCGYRGTGPVQIGNPAATQRQLDAYGELVNLTWRWHRRGHSPDDDDWRFLVSLIDLAVERCTDPDSGMWEWPGEPDHFVHSKVCCWAALDRGIRLADECMRRAPTRRWKRSRDELRETIETRGYDPDRGIFTQAYDRPELDSALLLLPTVEFLAWDDERMLRTVAAIREELGAGDGLLYRYRRDDGLEGDEGAFLCCSFWLVECLARAGEREEAERVLGQATSYANDLGLFAEEVDPTTGELRGNFPQGLTHLAHISAVTAVTAKHTTAADHGHHRA